MSDQTFLITTFFEKSQSCRSAKSREKLPLLCSQSRSADAGRSLAPENLQICGQMTTQPWPFWGEAVHYKEFSNSALGKGGRTSNMTCGLLKLCQVAFLSKPGYLVQQLRSFIGSNNYSNDRQKKHMMIILINSMISLLDVVGIIGIHC